MLNPTDYYSWYKTWDELLQEHICWEGQWGDIDDAKCDFKPKIIGHPYLKCPHCNDVIGYRYINCNMCNIPTSQCLLVYLYGICRTKEDHLCGFAQSALCKNCFIKAKKQMIDMKISHLPKELYEPIFNYIYDNWKSYQK